jgi:glucan phosphoethanolaminetransferase (alkaline phosphatase superfamily)
MYGVVVHANKVSMILDEDYVNTFPKWLTYLMNLIFIYINIIIYSWMFLRLEMWWDGASLVATLIQVSLLIVLLLAVFNKYSYKLDFTLLIVALFLCGNFIEFYFGLIKPGLLRFKTIIPALGAKNNVKQDNID